MSKNEADRYLHYGHSRPKGCLCEPPPQFNLPEKVDEHSAEALIARSMKIHNDAVLGAFLREDHICPIHARSCFYRKNPNETEPDPSLKPCPMCGGKAQLVYGNDGRGSLGAEPSYHVVRCGKCGASSPQILEHYDAEPGHTKKRAAKLWNRRKTC